MKTIDDVKNFWEKNPLFLGESKFSLENLAFFEEHRKICIKDCFAGCLDERIFTKIPKQAKILDLGCGPGFWVIEFLTRGYKHIHAADLTETAIKLVKNRVALYNYATIETSVNNAEKLTFQDNEFDHVNCQGVIHHSPNIEQCLKEISRILKEHGTASISVYYKNVILRNWKYLRLFGVVLSFLGIKLPGRGRENIVAKRSVDDIVRVYDGVDNPIGKAYSRKEFLTLLQEYFEVQEVYYHFFPARAFPIKIPIFIHRLLERWLPFMIYVNVVKRKLR